MGFDIIKLILTNILLIIFAYQVFYFAYGFFKKAGTYTAKEQHRYAVLVCARNESTVIPYIVKSVLEQDYPKDRFKIYVCADNCTDDTAEAARRAGAVVYERFNEKQKGKGYALDYLLHMIWKDEGADAYEGFFVFDADNLLKKDFIAQMNTHFDNGFRVITSLRNSKNFSHNWITGCSSLWFIREARFINHPRMELGIPCFVTGTGYLVHSGLLHELGGWPFHLLTEDAEFTVECMLRKEKIGYCDTAVCYDEQPVSVRDTWNQRIRWTKGLYTVFYKYHAPLLKGLFSKRCFIHYDFLITLCSGFVFLASIILLVIVNAVQAGGVNAAFWLLIWNTFWQGFLSAYLLFFAMALLTTLAEWKVIYGETYKKILYCFAFPIFMAFYAPMAVIALLVKVKWKHIDHIFTELDGGIQGEKEETKR